MSRALGVRPGSHARLTIGQRCVFRNPNDLPRDGTTCVIFAAALAYDWLVRFNDGFEWAADERELTPVTEAASV